MRLRGAAWLTLVGIFSLSGPFTIWAGDPTEEVRVAIDKSIQILDDPNLQSEDKKQERIEQLRGIVYPLFGFTEMARRSLGRHRRRRSREEQQEFITLFTDLLEIS